MASMSIRRCLQVTTRFLGRRYDSRWHSHLSSEEMTTVVVLELKRGERRNKETIPGCCLATVEGTVRIANVVRRSRKQRMEPLCCCWRKGGGGEQHPPSVVEMAPMLREEV